MVSPCACVSFYGMCNCINCSISALLSRQINNKAWVKNCYVWHYLLRCKLYLSPLLFCDNRSPAALRACTACCRYCCKPALSPQVQVNQRRYIVYRYVRPLVNCEEDLCCIYCGASSNCYKPVRREINYFTQRCCHVCKSRLRVYVSTYHCLYFLWYAHQHFIHDLALLQKPVSYYNRFFNVEG